MSKLNKKYLFNYPSYIFKFHMHDIHLNNNNSLAIYEYPVRSILQFRDVTRTVEEEGNFKRTKNNDSIYFIIINLFTVRSISLYIFTSNMIFNNFSWFFLS